MIEILDQLDKDIFLYLNGLHHPVMDKVMWFITGKKEWIPFYVLLAGFLGLKYRWQSLWILLAIGISITLADQFSSGFCKPFFERLRPSHQPDLAGMVHLVKNNNGEWYLGGKYGFISSHAANTFALAAFLFFLLRRHFRWVGFLFLWAGIVSYSRIYIGVHYPGDIVAGALAGVSIGYGVCMAFFGLWQKFYRGKWPERGSRVIKS